MLNEETFDLLLDEDFIVKFYREEEINTKETEDGDIEFCRTGRVFNVCELVKFDLVFDELLKVAGWMEKEQWHFDGITAVRNEVVLKFIKELISNEQ